MPDIVPLPIPIPIPISPVSKVAGGINTTDLTSDFPDPPTPSHVLTPTGTTEVCTPQTPLLSYVNGPFRILRLLSSGSFAKAIGAEDLSSGRLLCFKVFSKNRLRRSGTGRGVLNELAVYKRLASLRESCPETTFLMELEMSFQTKKNICFVMDLMTNDLLHYMENDSSYCLQNARRWSAQMALGINALHNMGIIHRDIKAENVLIDIRQNVRIADFGLSYLNEEPKPLNIWWDYASGVKGTIYCMAPEILRNQTSPNPTKYGTPVDWWAFGCVLYELMSPPDHKELFDSEEAIMEYVSWDSRHYAKLDLFPAFRQLDALVVDLVVGLLNPFAILRYGFQQVTDHRYFSNDDGTSEFHNACSRALQREQRPQMLPTLWDEQTQSIEIWSGRSIHPSNVDWRKPRP